MENENMTQLILTCILSSAVISTLITSIKELVLWKLNRKAHVEDKGTDVSERLDDIEESRDEFLVSLEGLQEGESTLKKSISSIKDDIQKQRQSMESLSNSIENLNNDLLEQLKVMKKSDRYILEEHIKSIALERLAEGKITFDDRKKLHDMWNLYHHGLGANGDLNPIMDQIDLLPLDLSE